jgi:hypothetical protein
MQISIKKRLYDQITHIDNHCQGEFTLKNWNKSRILLKMARGTVIRLSFMIRRNIMNHTRVVSTIIVLMLTGFGHSAGQIILSEIMFNPCGSEHHNEFVEIVNTGADTVRLHGWRIGDGSDSDHIIDAGSGLNLGPGQYGLILDPDYTSDPGPYAGLIPPACLVVTINGTTFGHSGFSNSLPETVSLTDTSGLVRAAYTYEPDNESGYSDEKIVLNNDDSVLNWKNSLRYGGTPGFENSVSKGAHSGAGELIITPNPFSPNGDGYEDEAFIRYHFPVEKGRVNCRILDIRGRLIRVLAGAEQSGAAGFFTWDGSSDSGNLVSTGIYIVYLEGLNSSAGLKAQLKGTVIVAGR